MGKKIKRVKGKRWGKEKIVKGKGKGKKEKGRQREL